MKKVFMYLLYLSLILIPLNVNASTCKYEVDISYPDDDVKLSCHENYNDALNAMNNYKSTEKQVAVIKNNGRIINAKYAIAKIDVHNEAEIQYRSDGVKNLYRTSYAAYSHSVPTYDPDFLTYIASTWGADAAFLNYDPQYNTVNIKISGVNGWLKKDEVIIIPISKYYSKTFNYPSNRPKIKSIKSSITLRSGPSTDSESLRRLTSTNQVFEYYPSQTKEDDTYYWYKVKYDANTVGWLASKKDENWLMDVSILRNDTYYYSIDNILYHHVHKGASFADVNMTLGTAPFVYTKPKVKTYYLANSTNNDINANNRYFSFDSNYFYQSYSQMIDDYRNGNYNNAINKDYPYYAYFMYIPSRSFTGYDANSFNQMVINKGYTSFPVNPKNYINPNTGSFKSGMSAGTSSMMFGIGESIIKAQNTYGANAMNIFSNAVRESATGTSPIAFYKNNLFGMGAVDGNAFNGAYTYDSVEASVMDYAKKLSYGNAYSNINDYRYNGTHEGNKLSGKGVQYASDPYSGESSTGLSFWSDFNSGKVDEFKNTLGIKNNSNLVNIYSEPNSSSRVIYQTKNNANGRILTNLSFIVTDYLEVNENNKTQGYYKVYTDLSLNDDRYYDNNTYYTFKNSYGYIKKEDLYVSNHQPVINAENIHIRQFEEFKSNATADDYENGDLTNRIEISGEINNEIPGDYKITYTVYDNENFKATKDIIVTVDATDKPIINLEDVTIPQYVEYDPLTGVTAYDRVDGDLKVEIKSGTLNINEIGTYEFIYTAKDKDNNITEAKRIITVIANEYPVINANNVVTYINEPFNALNGVTASDKEDGNITSRITYEGEIDVSKAGSFEITYKVIDNANQMTSKTITVTVEEKKFIMRDNIFNLYSLEYNKDTKKLDISGFLIIKGMHNTLTTSIKYDIIFVNQFDGNEIVMPLSRFTSGMPYDAPSSNGFDNKGSWFKESLAVNSLPNGDYTVYIRARSGDFEAKTVLKNPFFNEKFARKFEIDGKGFLFKTNYSNKLIPLELSVREDGLIANVNNPTIDNMYNQVYDINLKDDKLLIEASSHNVKGNYAINQTVERNIYLENIKTSKIAKSYNVGSVSDGPYPIRLKVDDGFSKTRAWYRTTLDLSNIPVGTYAIYVRTKTGNIDDYGELYDVLFKEVNRKSIYNGRIYSISRNDNMRYRIELKIEEET